MADFRALGRLRDRAFGSRRRNDPDQRYHEAGWLQRLAWFLLPGRVSRIHLYEAQDRYRHLRGLLRQFATDTEKNPEYENCKDILDQASLLLNRRQRDLSYLWRELTRAHIMILDGIIPKDRLSDQIDLCREEALRLRLTKDPEVTVMLQRLAEVTDTDAPKKDQIVRAVTALLERFKTIRTGRIHQQFVNMRVYALGLLLLAPICVIFIANGDIFLQRGAGDVASLPAVSAPPTAGLLAWVGKLLRENVMAFVFFSGLAGGFFSVVIRVRDQNLEPGEDAYFMLYVLGKPFVGAFGAAVLYVLVVGDLVTIEALGPLREFLGERGPVLFGFAFLSGFSERLMFPTVTASVRPAKS